ncbi:MAG: hypothetical protein ACI9FJ_002128 [Alteromonadaceae bacterium]|jgi:hypothetical protein
MLFSVYTFSLLMLPVMSFMAAVVAIKLILKLDRLPKWLKRKNLAHPG